mmetsp:Transcript_16054/g.31437  ORF Transcript_16054/g.31437 Transcript_16054/m.31437 type:complete len:82 (+) Transcript_16054:74-319(+)
MNLFAALLLVLKHAFPANPRSVPVTSVGTLFLITTSLARPNNPPTLVPGDLNNEMGWNEVRVLLRIAENIVSGGYYSKFGR